MTSTAPRVSESTAAERAGPGGPGAGLAGRHILTVSVEEYFHGGALSQVVLRKHWDRFESRVDRSVDLALHCLQRHSAQATFFVLGLLAERNPELVRRIAAAGHEVASRGFWPRGVDGMMAEEFAEDLDRTKAAIEAAGGNVVLGYRSPRRLRHQDRWVFDVLAQKGYAYDASVNPVAGRLGRDPGMHVVGRHAVTGGHLWEVPVSTASFLGMRFAIGGGNWWRQMPRWLVRRGIDQWLRDRRDPLVCYFMPWELDPDQPLVTAAAALDKVKQYRNLGRTQVFLDEYLARLQFVSVARWLDLPLRRPSPPPQPAAPAPVLVTPHSGPRQAVSVVVPIFNEADNIPYLLRTMAGVADRLRDRYDLDLVLVDDGSTDGSVAELERLTAGRADVQIVRHPHNRGIAAAILTGLRAARAEIAVSVDCDCSYDPAEIEAMVPLLADADLVTASPYHPQGQVLNVPRWRLFLSRGLSWLYRRATGAPLSTWTSCFRVYRRPALLDVPVQHGGFLGIAELLLRVVRRGGKVVEHPALLEARLLGVSKMKTLRVIRGHLGLLWQVLRGRLG